ncbi:hypothetical protein FSP39_002974 [Pinctada imbricata]|uniref:AIG1-type G domain-containing protein n=1 Tax=Pinctada imbricata TaxID=66713 RepID=A0AA88XH10_PINIB|nr:hypothetical protein FSP39_002974 [Pinctada imbricata]
MRIAIIGVTGAGKSALANTILMEKKFLSLPSCESVTEKCQKEITRFENRSVVVVDTPGFNDTRMEKRHLIKKEVSTCILMLEPGPHAFLIVLNPNRFLEEERKCLTNIEHLFGAKEFYKFCIVVFTREKEILDAFRSVEEFISRNTCSDVKDVVRKCSNRVMTVENLTPFSELKKELILNRIKDLTLKNREAYFPHIYFRTANILKRNSEYAKASKQKIEELQNIIDELTKKIEKMEMEKYQKQNQKGSEISVLYVRERKKTGVQKESSVCGIL